MARCVITGFSRFLDYPDNPSELLVKKLMKVETSPDFKMRVLDTSYDSVDYFLNDLSLDPPKALIMIGQDKNASGIKVEQYAHNETSAEHADVFGATRSGDIAIKAPAKFETNCNLTKICNLNSQVYVSKSAGSYVCNYIYFKALDYLRHKTKIIFIHMPFFDFQADDLEKAGIKMSGSLISEAQALSTIQNIIEIILNDEN